MADLVDIGMLGKKLGLTLAQLNKLDAIDGAKDGKIAKSVFDTAAAIIGNDEEAINAAKQNGEANLFEKVKKALREAGAVAEEATSDLATDEPPTKPAQGTDNADEPQLPEVLKMQEMAEAAIKYYEINGSMKGFTFTGFPLGIQSMDINTQLGFDDASNDTFTFTDDGQQVATRKADAFTLSIKFVFDGKSYTVNAESKNVEVFGETAREEFISNIPGPNSNPASDY